MSEGSTRVSSEGHYFIIDDPFFSSPQHEPQVVHLGFKQRSLSSWRYHHAYCGEQPPEQSTTEVKEANCRLCLKIAASPYRRTGAKERLAELKGGD